MQEPALCVPVQLDPPSPVPPASTKSFHSSWLLLTPSGVPARSEFPRYGAEQVEVPLPATPSRGMEEGFTQARL